MVAYGKKPGTVVNVKLGISLFALSAAAAFAGDELRGPAFDPSRTPMEMDSGWTEQGIKRGADITLSIDLNQQLELHLKPMVEQFAKERGIKLSTTRGTCGKSGGRISRKEVDVGGFCCPPGAIDRLPGLRYHTIGIQPLAFFVNTRNPVDGMTLKELRDIYQGKIDRWSAVGGKDAVIQVVGSHHCAKRPGHWRLLLDSPDLFGPRFLEEGDMEDNIVIITQSPNAITYETLTVAKMFESRGPVKALKIDGVHPTELTKVATLEYPIYRTFNVTTWSEEPTQSEDADALVAFLTAEIERVGREIGLVPVSSLREAGWQFEGDELVGEPAR
jgi:phosphate transport system substrate-binding protein